MAENDRLTPRQTRFLAALFVTTSIVEAAEVAHIGETTGWRYLRDPVCQAALARLQDGVLTGAAAGLAGDLTLARETLRATMKDAKASPAARVAAASAVLSAALKLIELASLAQRIAALERGLGVEDAGAQS